MPLLDVRDLTVSFQSDKRPVSVVQNLSFHVDESEIFGLAGESGCGKSITAFGIMGILPAHASARGEVIFRGKDLIPLDAETKRSIRGNEMSMIFQEPMTSLNPVLTIGFQIAEVLVTHRGMKKKDAMFKAIEILESVRIPSPAVRLNEYPHQLSGGMRQRVMIAMAIACRPSLLIADEPTTALDVTIQAQILELLQRLRAERGMSLLLITHDLGIIAENTSRVGIMYAGQMMETAKTAVIFHNPRHPYTRGLFESTPKGKGQSLTPIPGAVPRPQDIGKGCPFAGRCRYAEERCREVEQVFEEISNGHWVRCMRAREI